MIVNKTKSFTTLKPEFEGGNKGGKKNSFFKEFNENYTNFKKENLILDFSDDLNIDSEEILLFSQTCDEHRKNGKSFIFVCKGVDFENLPDNIIIVPTHQEAADIIELEEIERDLGI